MKMYCNVCGRETEHKNSGEQRFPKGNLETYACSKCNNLSSVGQDVPVILANSYDTGKPVAGWGKGFIELAPEQERDLLHQSGDWYGGQKEIRGLPVKAKRSLFG